jgi:modification methylase
LSPDRTGKKNGGTPAPRKRRGTKTSSFGSPGRASHDSTSFYGSRLYEGLSKEKEKEKKGHQENPIPAELLDRVFCKSSEAMEELPDDSVHLVVTSPPYNVGKEYDRDLTLTEYRDLLRRVWAEAERVLVPGGRCCINVANLGRRPYIPLHALIIEDMAALGFLMRGEVIWAKEASSSSSTAWGSWLSATNPTLRDVHEYILVFSKTSFSREGQGRKSTITRDEFLEFTKSVWRFDAERARAVGHPAPFPVELPYRCIQLYTFEGDVVLDPFMGSGQTAIAALRTGRRYVGYEVDQNYVRLSESRIGELAGRRTQAASAEEEEGGAATTSSRTPPAAWRRPR